MTLANLVNNLDSAIAVFKKLSTDDQLAVLWYAYEEMGDAITPAAPGAASPEISGGLVEQFKSLNQNDQLEEMRAIAQGQNTQISREYGSLGPDTKLATWYQLAEGMKNGTIVPMPDDYELAEEGTELLAALETIDFEQQITLFRNIVTPMGAEPKSGAAV
jgi:hypothetical protein